MAWTDLRSEHRCHLAVPIITLNAMGMIPAQVLSRHSWTSKRSLWRGHAGAIPWGSFTQPVPILTPMMLSMPTEPPSPGVVSCSGQERHRGSEVQGQDLWAGEHTEQPGISLPCTCSSHFVSYDCLFYFLFFYFEEVSHQLGKKKKDQRISNVTFKNWESPCSCKPT